MAKEPKQNRGNSKQDYQTPPEFLAAVSRLFGKIDFDLAATVENSVAGERFYSIEDDSLSRDWTLLEGNLWLNPPFARIEPWAKKCRETFPDPTLAPMIEFGWKRASIPRKVLLLTPASVGSTWFLKYVNGRAFVIPLSPRLTFVGESHPYPKDCMLSVYGINPGVFRPWRWKP
jgi:phage N-6-adenine-methyltransferase